MKQRSIGIDVWGQFADALALAVGEVGYDLTAERDKAGDAVGILAVDGKPAFVESDHTGKKSSGRVTADEQPLGIASVFFGIVEGPSHSLRRIVDTFVYTDLRNKPVVGCDYYISLIEELGGDSLLSAGKTAAMKPHYHGQPFVAEGMMNIEFEPAAGVVVRLAGVGDVVLRDVFDLCKSWSRDKGYDEKDDKFFHDAVSVIFRKGRVNYRLLQTKPPAKIICRRFVIRVSRKNHRLIFLLIEEEVVLRRIVGPYIFDRFVYVALVFYLLQVFENFQRSARTNGIVYQLLFGGRPGCIFKFRCQL